MLALHMGPGSFGRGNNGNLGQQHHETPCKAPTRGRNQRKRWILGDCCRDPVLVMRTDAALQLIGLQGLGAVAR
jgi:alpha-tubulin suppressor-like RCC1 family protein